MVMFRIAVTSYPRFTSQLKIAVCSRGVRLSSFRLRSSNIGNFQEEYNSQLPKYDERVENEKPAPLKTEDLPNVKTVSSHLEISNPLRLFTSVEEILNYLKSNAETNFYQYRHVFSTILKYYESGRSTLSAEEICRSAEFEKLAKDVESNVRSLKVEDAITILRVLINLGISTNSTLCQSLLRMISKRVNRLNLKTILFLDIVLSRCSRSPLVDHLEITIPVVFETQVHSRLDPDDCRTLASALCFAFKSRSISVKTRELLVDAAVENVHQFEQKEILGILRKLTFAEDDPKNTRDLYAALMTKLSENIDQLELSDAILSLSRVVIHNYLNVDESFFNHEIVDKAIESAIRSDKFRPLDVGIFLRHLNKISYYCPALLKYIDEHMKLIQQSEDFHSLPRILIFSFIISCSNCSYKPRNWNMYEERIVSFLEENKGYFSWMLATDLMILKCWPKALVEYCFQEELWRKIHDLEEDEHMPYRTMMNMYQVVKLLYSSYYTGPYPSASNIDSIVKVLVADKEYPLLNALETGLGGLQYVSHGVITKSGQIIDYLIVKCKTGELYPINAAKSADDREISYESLHMPEDSYPIAIMLLNPSAYCLDGVRMRGRTKIKIRCLEVYGITPIPISYYEWLELEECEKVPYLTCKIDDCRPVSSSASKYR